MERSRSPPLRRDPAHANGHIGDVSFAPILSDHANSLVRNPIRRVVNQMMQNKKCLMLAGGRPVADHFPAAAQELGEAMMNYGPHLAVGTPELRAWVKKFMEKFHSPPGDWERRELVMTSGNTDGIMKAVLLLTNPGDIILAEQFTYPGITAVAKPMGRQVLGVKMDEQGIIPGEVEKLLKDGQVSSKIRVLYLCPHGQNPTGITLSVERKMALYTIARKYELTIVEDDTYFFLQLSPKSQDAPIEDKSMLGTEGFPKSFLSIDTDARVLRLDSVSKTLAPGFRIGWATMNKAVFEKWQVLAEVTSWSVAGFQQEAFMSTMKTWGDQGFHEHLQKLQCTYAQRRDFLLKACQKHLQGLCRWNVPDFGMFLWLEVIDIEDTQTIIDELISTYNIAMVPGGSFDASGNPTASAFFRVSFSQINEEKADQAMASLRQKLMSHKKSTE